MNIKKIKILLSIVVLILIVAVIVKTSNGKDKRKFKTLTPSIRTIERKIIVPGTIVPAKEIDIKSTFSGVMEQLYVKVGEYVFKGQAIAKIKFVSDPKEYQNNLRRYQIAEAHYKNNQKNLERTKLLYDKKIIPLSEYEDIQTNWTATKAEYDAALKELLFVEGKQTDIEGISNIIYSTDAGTVLELPIKEGGSIMARGAFSEGSSIAKLASLSTLLFKGMVNEGNVSDIKTGMYVKIIIGALNDMEIGAKLSLISPKGIFRDGIAKFDIEANIVMKKNETLRAGYSANAEFILERKEDILSVEEKYFIFKQDSVYIEIVENNKLKQVKVLTGVSDGIYTEIISGMNAETLIHDKY
jgi:HlyD family secretion protein